MSNALPGDSMAVVLAVRNIWAAAPEGARDIPGAVRIAAAPAEASVEVWVLPPFEEQQWVCHR